MKFLRNKLVIFLLLTVCLAVGLFSFGPDIQAGDSNSLLFGGYEGNLQDTSGLGNTDVRVIAGNVIRIALGFLGVIAVILILYGGWLYMTSMGDASQIDKAKQVLVSAAVGLVIVTASFGITQFIMNRLYDATGAAGGTPTCSSLNVGVCNGCVRCADFGSGSYGWSPDSSCAGCGASGPGSTSCDGNTLTAVCDPDNTICDGSYAPGTYFCDIAAGCSCQPLGTLGDPCDGDPITPVCDADDSLCMADLSCEDDITSPDICTCTGAPVIDYISPVGMFCMDSAGLPTNDSCRTDAECALIDATYTGCNTTTPNGAPGNFITIGGRFFGTTAGTVWFWDGADFNIPATFPSSVNGNCGNTWQEDQVVVVVPGGAMTDGPIRIERSDGAADATDNSRGLVFEDFIRNTIERPGLCLAANTEPVSNVCSGLDCGFLDDGFNLQGTLFAGTTQDVRFGSLALNMRANAVTGWTGSAVNGDVPNLSAGANTVFVEIDNEISNFLNFEVRFDFNNQPVIDYIDPSSGPIGQYVTIYGSGFQEYLSGTSMVQFYNSSFGTFNADGLDFPIECRDSWWNNTFITVKVPETIAANIGSYEVTVTNRIANTSDAENFAVTGGAPGPGICLLSPVNGPINQTVNIFGDNFGNVQGAGFVRFYNSTTATVYSGWANQLVSTAVPSGASSGPVELSTGAGLSNSLPFMVGYCSDDTQCGGDVCCGAGTYWSGICRPAGDCSTGGPTLTGYGWRFSTSDGPPPDPLVCGGYSDNAACLNAGETCPNSLGECATRGGVVTGECSDTYCNATHLLCMGSCVYDDTNNLCQANAAPLQTTCDQTSTTVLAGSTTVCRPVTGQYSGQYVWQTNTTSCPSGTFPDTNGWCTVGVPGTPLVCDSCSLGFNCVTGECYINQAVCNSNSTCNVTGECVMNNDICECCCRVGYGGTDCCYGLTCSAGGCGDDPIDYGLCTGCRVNLNGVDTDHTLEEEAASDLACNCSGTFGKICEVADPLNPADTGACRDATPCDSDEHTSVCDADNAMCATGQYCDTDCFCKNAMPCDNNATVGDGCALASNCNLATEYCDTTDCYCKPTPACDVDDNLNNGCSRDNTKCPPGMYCGTNCYCSTGTSCDIDPVAPGCDNAAICGVGFTCDAVDCTCRPDPGGAGDQCTSAFPACSAGFYGCGYGYDCIDSGGADCRCCCDPLNDMCGGSLTCWPDRGDCSGATRGLCCGCTSDAECSGGADGCGSDTCCYTRPNVLTVTPPDEASGGTDVCRNTVISVNFDQSMNISSFIGNSILIGDYGVGGTCPSGTNYLAFNGESEPSSNIFVRSFNRFLGFVSNILKPIIGEKLASAYTPANSVNNYCAVQGVSTGYNNVSGNGVLNFKISQVLDPTRLYYVVIKGDDNIMDNQSEGVLNSDGVGMIGNATVLGDFTFNGINYANSYVWSFRTGTEICKLSYIKVAPISYLFQTSNTDEAFVASPRTITGEVITAVPGYNWSWTWNSDNVTVATVTNTDDPVQTVTSKNVQDGRTYINANATITTDSVMVPSTLGSVKKGTAQVFVMLCENPWPPISLGPIPPAGTWYPWRDNVEGAASCVGTCSDTNYELYYCRDAGGPGTHDDLPAIIDTSTVVLGSSLKCTDESSIAVCASYGASCGTGVCEYNIFKEAYFFRENVPTATTTISVVSLAIGRGATASWDTILGVNGYKLYWGETSGTYPNYTNISTTGVSDRSDVNCTFTGTTMDCVVTGLIDDKKYYFNLSAYVGAESPIFGEVSIEVKDITPPAIPIIFNTDPGESSVRLEWNVVSDAVEYIVYFTDEASKAAIDEYPFFTDPPVSTTVLDIPGLDNGVTYYFVVTALDASGNESAYSIQVTEVPVPAGCGDAICDAGECASGCTADCAVTDCCGTEGCNAVIGETSTNCPTDCSGPPPPPPPPPPPGTCDGGTCDAGECASGCTTDCSVADCCGNSTCDALIGEDAGNCAGDCGGGPPPPPPPPPPP